MSRPPGRRSQRLRDLSYWPVQHALGLWRLWRFNGPLPAVALTACNLVGLRRQFRVRLFGFAVELRSGTPDLMVAIDSLGGEFEPVSGFHDPAGLIIDAGGYIGTAALKLAATYPRSTVITIEPASANLTQLRRNVAGVPNIRVLHAALAVHGAGVALTDGGAGEWGFSTVAGAGQPPGRHVETVATVTIESILERQGISRLFLLKLDVEGAEAEILKASDGWLPHTDILVAELHERFVPGAEAAFAAATRERRNSRLPGEKMLSLRVGFLG